MTTTDERTTATAATTPATMRPALANPTHGVHLEQAPTPAPGPGEVLVRSTLVGICGSDTHALAGTHPFLTAPYVPGHEATGIVVATGPDVREPALGQRVLLKPNLACGTCVNCRAGRSNACESLQWIGCDPTQDKQGAMADFFLAPQGNLFAVPEELDDESAVLVECLATPVHAASLVATEITGARVAVLGAGTIGLLSVVVAALHAGAASVVVTDMDQGKLDCAVRVGAASGVLATSPRATEEIRSALGGPADIVFDCVASERSLAQALAVVRRAATVLLVGVPARAGTVNLPIAQDWELRVQGCAAYTARDIQTSISIATQGGLPGAEIISARFGLDHVADAFEHAAANSSGKVLLDLR